MARSFSYSEAFSRNIGWVTSQEQEVLRHKRIAIAGMGGVGGVHLLTLARLGIGAFNIADFDVFDMANFNRQAGAAMSSLGRPKAEVMASMAKDINPELDIRIFPEGIGKDNLAAFFADVDLYVDGLDFFVFPTRQATFAACAELGIPAVTAAPLGMGTAVLNFMPGGMTFEEYFRLGDLPEEEKALRFLLGLAPAGLHFGYLADPSRVDLANHRGPSTAMACQLCAGVAATEALKILLNRGNVRAAPHGLHFDAYRGKLARTCRPGGNGNPLQRLMLAVARKRLGKQIAMTPVYASESSSHGTATPSPLKGEGRGEGESPLNASAPLPNPLPKGERGLTTGTKETAAPTTIEQILDLARWAPSGDNTQPWRFEIIDEHNLVVHGFDTRDHCIYDLDGRPSQISIGALLETIAIAASGHGLRAGFRRRADTPDSKPTFDVRFESDPAVRPDPLIPYIPYRSVQRRPMRTRPLTPREKQALEAAVGSGYRILWLEGFRSRLNAARLMFDNAKLRLTIPEAYEVHRSIIQWNSRFSEDRVPDQALGVDPLTLELMRWVMQSWQRVEFFNTYLAGTLAPRIQMDLIPGIACAAHFAILAEREPKTIDDHVDAGRAVQRFWLTATKLGLQLQPEMTPLIFGRYAREGMEFSKTAKAKTQAENLLAQLERLLGKSQTPRSVFMGRIGAGRAPVARSVRLPLSRLVSRP
ncbi:MAG: ThiF family adenylyltransferase [Pseudomonadota bacterium]